MTTRRSGKDRTGVITNKALHVNGVAEVVFKPEKFRTTARLMQTLKLDKEREFGDPKGYDETLQELNSARYLPQGKKCLNIACHLYGREVRWENHLPVPPATGFFAEKVEQLSFPLIKDYI